MAEGLSKASLLVVDEEVDEMDEEAEEKVEPLALASLAWSMLSCSSMRHESRRMLLVRTWMEPKISSLSAPTRMVDHSLEPPVEGKVRKPFSSSCM